mmetsp:Transcript_54667/g.158767  ORF Transcript_54667/g.158767 Transcript_54667/m.158767 type:complete len:210 (+) Transcript_54667:15-644(+)
MLAAGYDSSDSDAGGGAAPDEEEEEDGGGAAAPMGGVQDGAGGEGDEHEESEEEDGGIGADGDKPLPSAGAAFASVGEDGLEFKKFAAAKERTRRVQAHTMSLDRVAAASAATLRSQGWQPASASGSAMPQQARGAGEAEATLGEKRTLAADADASAGYPGGKGKGKGKDGMSVKEKTRLKRFKGQSGEDHSGRMWKPEVWMKIRQEFD